MRHEGRMAKTVSWDGALFLAFFLLFFFVWPACQIRAGCKVVQEEGVNCRYTRQGLTNLLARK